jgi:hypothetical protein
MCTPVHAEEFSLVKYFARRGVLIKSLNAELSLKSSNAEQLSRFLGRAKLLTNQILHAARARFLSGAKI